MNKKLTDKINRCRFSHPSMRDIGACHCVVDGWEDEQVKTVTKENCEICEKFKSRYIEYPLTIQGIENKKIDTKGIGHTCGALCEVRPCGEEYQGKTYLGIYLGDLPIGISSSYDENTGVLCNHTINNPAIFVPELRKIVYGMASWWREIKGIEEFKGISKEEIENTWYVKLLKGMEKE